MLGLAACGGGESELTAAEYRQQADTICAETRAALGGLEDPQTPEEVAPALRRALVPIDDQLERLDDLTPPEELTADHDRALDALTEQRGLIGEAAQAIQDGEDAATVTAQLTPELERLDGVADTAARELGLTVCGSGDPSAAGAEVAPPPEPDPVPASEGDETALRARFREDYTAACGAERPEICACTVNEVSGAFPNEIAFAEFTQALDRRDPDAVARVRAWSEDCAARTP